MSIKSAQKQMIILPMIKQACLSFKPELIDHLINLIMCANKESRNREISEMRAKILFRVLIKTEKSRTEELSKNLELLCKNTSETRFSIDYIYGAR